MWLKPKKYLCMTKTKTAAREGFGNFKFGPRAQTACRPLIYLNVLNLRNLFDFQNSRSNKSKETYHKKTANKFTTFRFIFTTVLCEKKILEGFTIQMCQFRDNIK